LTIEHGGEGNKVPADYAATSFFYLQTSRSDREHLANAASRSVREPQEIVFVPGWNEAIAAFSFQNMILQKQEVRIDGQDVRVLSVEAHGEDMFGPHYIAFTLPIPTEGEYAIILDALRGPSQGTIELMIDNKLTGQPVHFAAVARDLMVGVELGSAHLVRGENQLFFQLKSESGSDSFRADLVRIRCRRK
jgi:hypothetical protein